MNIETLANESQETLETQPALESTPEQMSEIRPLAFESFKLIGGGSSAVVL
jgi:hypothetical protein